MTVSRISRFREKENRIIAGVMSGTSLDAVDVALVSISGTASSLTIENIGFASQPFTSELKARVSAACANLLNLRETFELDADLGICYSNSILSACLSTGVDVSEIDAIGLHGQTVYHAPLRDPAGASVQLGSGAIVAERLNTIVVNDFRVNDV